MEHNIADGVNLRIKRADEIEAEQIRKKINRMAEIKRQQESLKTEWAELEAFFLELCTSDLADTKNKTAIYSGSDGKITATMPEAVKIVWPGRLKEIFGKDYEDAVTETTKHTLSKAASRMLCGIWTGGYCMTTVAEIISQLPCDEKKKQTLTKKLKGIKFDTDKKNLMQIGGLSESDAEHYAYFVAEAAVWESFKQLLTINEINDDAGIKRIMELIDGAVVVEENPKVALELIEQ